MSILQNLWSDLQRWFGPTTGSKPISELDHKSTPTKPKNRREIIRRLAELYSRHQSIRRIARGCGLLVSRIEFGGSALDIWDEVVEEAVKVGRFEQLMAVVREEYPDFFRE